METKNLQHIILETLESNDGLAMDNSKERNSLANILTMILLDNERAKNFAKLLDRFLDLLYSASLLEIDDVSIRNFSPDEEVIEAYTEYTGSYSDEEVGDVELLNIKMDELELSFTVNDIQQIELADDNKTFTLLIDDVAYDFRFFQVEEMEA